MRSTSQYLVQTYLDAAEQETALRGWGQRYVQLAGGKFRGSLTQIDFGHVSVGEERINVSVGQSTAPPLGKVVLILPIDEHDCLINGDRYAPAAFLHRGGHEINVVTAPVTRGLYVTVDEALLPAYDRRLIPPIAAVTNYAGAAELREWLSSLLMSAPDAARQAPGEMEKVLPGLIIDKVSEVCAAVTPLGSASKLRESHAYSIFVRAQRRLDADSEGLLTVADLAADLGVPDHLLRSAFVQATGLNPAVWLRHRRLDRARRALTQSSGVKKSVAQIAMENGFFHFGRFAAYYAETFHETPLETLRSALL